ncbi:hypothetical protein [Hymenobacter lapidiphilus]|uniref:DUF2490 domain-containing protein n=1 Tax=Hymenobacter lapidiphilus TaxID=2608003 RepID=A0A7Y7PN14_9BACT|nr:hypothetical protein [Hymenobacter lapidiphilus]NVO30767.1 hypothetical protein [Hymenobacter lapidiphilus]
MKAPPRPRAPRRWPLLLAAAALPLAATAQTAPPDTATTYKHQLGLTASPVLDGFFKNNRSLPLGLLYKRQTKPNQALRVRVVGQYSRRDTTDFATFDKGSTRYFWRAEAYVGYEWQKALGRRVQLGYGAELGAATSQRVSKFVGDKLTGIGFEQDRGRETDIVRNVLLRPFVSLSYRLGRVHLFAETAVETGYRTFENDRKTYLTIFYYEPDGSIPPQGQLQSSSRYFRNRGPYLTWRPVQLIGASIDLK